MAELDVLAIARECGYWVCEEPGCKKCQQLKAFATRIFETAAKEVESIHANSPLALISKGYAEFIRALAPRAAGE